MNGYVAGAAAPLKACLITQPKKGAGTNPRIGDRYGLNVRDSPQWQPVGSTGVRTFASPIPVAAQGFRDSHPLERRL